MQTAGFTNAKGKQANLETHREMELDISAREALREAIRLNAAEMDRLRLALTERELRAAHLKQAVEAMEGARELETLAETVPATIPENFGQRQRVRRNSLAWATRRETFLILQRHGRPMTRKEIFRDLTKAGLKFNPKNPLQALTKILSGAKNEFCRTGDGYWLRNEPEP